MTGYGMPGESSGSYSNTAGRGQSDDQGEQANVEKGGPPFLCKICGINPRDRLKPPPSQCALCDPCYQRVLYQAQRSLCPTFKNKPKKTMELCCKCKTTGSRTHQDWTNDEGNPDRICGPCIYILAKEQVIREYPRDGVNMDPNICPGVFGTPCRMKSHNQFQVFVGRLCTDCDRRMRAEVKCKGVFGSTCGKTSRMNVKFVWGRCDSCYQQWKKLSQGDFGQKEPKGKGVQEEAQDSDDEEESHQPQKRRNVMRRRDSQSDQGLGLVQAHSQHGSQPDTRSRADSGEFLYPGTAFQVRIRKPGTTSGPTQQTPAIPAEPGSVVEQHPRQQTPELLVDPGSILEKHWKHWNEKPQDQGKHTQADIVLMPESYHNQLEKDRHAAAQRNASKKAGTLNVGMQGQDLSKPVAKKDPVSGTAKASTSETTKEKVPASKVPAATAKPSNTKPPTNALPTKTEKSKSDSHTSTKTLPATHTPATHTPATHTPATHTPATHTPTTSTAKAAASKLPAATGKPSSNAPHTKTEMSKSASATPSKVPVATQTASASSSKVAAGKLPAATGKSSSNAPPPKTSTSKSVSATPSKAPAAVTHTASASSAKIPTSKAPAAASKPLAVRPKTGGSSSAPAAKPAVTAPKKASETDPKNDKKNGHGAPKKKP